MSYIVTIYDKANNKWIMSTPAYKNVTNVDQLKVPYGCFINLPIKRFKNYTVGFSGAPVHIQKLLEEVNFQSFDPEKMSIRYLYDNVYGPMVDLLKDNHYVEPDKRGVLEDFNLSIVIMGHGKCFEVNQFGVYKVANHPGDNDSDCFVNYLHQDKKDKMSPLELTKFIFKEIQKHSLSVSYPLLYIESDSDKLHFVNEEGEEFRVETLPNYFDFGDDEDDA